MVGLQCMSPQLWRCRKGGAPTFHLTNAILEQRWDHIEDKSETKASRMRRQVDNDLEASLRAEELVERLHGSEKRSLQESLEGAGAVWLAAIPLEEAGFAFPRQTFRDAVAIRMGLPVPDPLPACCPSCGKEGAELAHYLKCSTGGWVRRRHTEVLKELSRLMGEVCETVIEEPTLGPIRGPPFTNKNTTTDPEARADILARGFFQPQQDAFFDVTIVDTAKKSALDKGLSPWGVLAQAQRDKRDKYDERVRRLGGTFTPFAASVYGTLAPESERVLLTLVQKLTKEKGERAASQACVRTRIQVAIVKATSMCIRSRAHDSNHFGASDGAQGDGVESEDPVEVGDLAGAWGDLRVFSDGR